MLKKSVHYSFVLRKSPKIRMFCCYFSSDKKATNNPNTQNFSKDYLKKIQENLTDFQNEFGFNESLRGMRLDNIKREKRSLRNFNVLAIAGITTVLSVFLMLFDRERGKKGLKKFYLTHTTNLSIKLARILPAEASSQKILNTIEHYVNDAKENKIQNSIFLQILLDQMSDIIQKLINNYSEQLNRNIITYNPKDDFARAIKITSDLLDLINLGQNQKINKTLLSNGITKNLISILSIGIVDIDLHQKEISKQLEFIFENLQDDNLFEVVAGIDDLIQNKKLNLEQVKPTSLSALAKKIQFPSNEYANEKIAKLSALWGIEKISYSQFRRIFESARQLSLNYHLIRILDQYIDANKTNLSKLEYENLYNLFATSVCS